MLETQIWPLTASVNEQGHLLIAGCDTVALAEAYSTPLYLFDDLTIRSACRAYRAAFARRYRGAVIVHYAGKAFLNSTIARIMAEEQLGLDVVSGGELYLALQAGVPAERIHLHGNAKPSAELVQALDAGIGQIVVDNLDELQLLASLTANRTIPQAIALRLAPEVATDTHAHIQTGHATSKFGLPLTALDAAGQLLNTAPGLRLVGLHAHLGSQLFDTEPFVQAIDVLLGCAALLRDRHAILVEEINTGGGLGVPYMAEQSLPDLDHYAIALSRAMADGCAAHGLPLLRLAVEPGRSIIARAGVAIYSIIATKALPHDQGGDSAIRYLHIDGGMGDNIRPSLYQARYTALLANRVAPGEELVDIAGRYCESGDVLLRNVLLPRAKPGDLLAVATSGAYTLSMASNYNLVSRPAVLLLSEGEARAIQRRETYADLIARDL